jgi:hypothetical protein
MNAHAAAVAVIYVSSLIKSQVWVMITSSFHLRLSCLVRGVRQSRAVFA